MEDTSRTDGSTEAESPSGPSSLFHVLLTASKLLIALAGGMGLWWAIWMAPGDHASAESWAWHASMPTAILALVGLMVYREARHWWAPGRTMATLLPAIRAGERPIEELAEVGGGLTPIVPLVQELLRDVRQQRLAVAELEAEMRQRVASRTSALERQLGSMRAQATRDPLTGLFNRRMLDSCLPKLIENCRADSVDLAVLAIDVDNFKELNDTLGHSAGDELLKSIGQIVRSGVRECDTAIRCGGDEFVVLLPGCPPHVARDLATRLTAMVHAMGKTLKTRRPAGLSVGLALLRQLPAGSTPEDAATELLKAADKHLYEVKAARKAGKAATRATVA